jgi:hypothetical protein
MLSLSFEGVPREPLSSLEEARARCRTQLDAMRPDHLRGLNPTPYKVVYPFVVYVCSYNIYMVQYLCKVCMCVLFASVLICFFSIVYNNYTMPQHALR